MLGLLDDSVSFWSLKMKIKGLVIAAICAVGFAGGASASTITFTEAQGLDSAGNAVVADRSMVSSLTDGDVNTFYSLGMGGSLTASIAPLQIGSASLIEVTFGNNLSYPESAQVFLSGTLLGEIFNTASGGVTTSANGATITASANTPSIGITSFMIALGLNIGSSLTFVDTSSAVPGYLNDGFDIGELSIVSAVPLPAGAWLLLTGLGGVVALRRRQNKA
jgi:hypothetical protein